MAFLKSLVAPLIGLGGSILGGELSKPNSQQNAALTAQAGLDKQLASNASQGQQTATTLTNLGTPAITNALNYWQRILSGDRTQMSSVLGPEVSQIGQGIASATNTASQFAPRGGARTTSLAELPFQQAGQVGNLYATLRPAAAAATGELGTSTTGLGSSFLGGSSSAASGGANSYLGLVSSLEGLRQNQQNTGKNIGSSLYTWAKGIDWGKLFGGSGGGTTTSFPGA